jgi:hypothetical protein
VSRVGHLLKDPGQASYFVHIVELTIDLFFAAHDFRVEQVRFHSEEAAQAPTGNRHDLDQIHFDAGSRFELIDVFIY